MRTMTDAERGALRGADGPTPPLHPHQHDALVAELKRPEWDGRAADEVFAAITTPGAPTASVALKRLAATRFVSREKYEAMARKDRPMAGVMMLTDEELGTFVLPAERERCAAAEVREKAAAARAGRAVDPTRLARPSASVPGFPNKVRREWFDRAWTEARG